MVDRVIKEKAASAWLAGMLCKAWLRLLERTGLAL
jgi:hypothetical protein